MPHEFHQTILVLLKSFFLIKSEGENPYLNFFIKGAKAAQSVTSTKDHKGGVQGKKEKENK
jgi:hypothetical protein